MHRRCLRFENLLLLGDGGIGRSFLHLAESELNGFRRVLVIDKAPMRLPAGRKNAETVLADLSRSGVLGSFLVKFPYGSALVLNLTLGLDHLLLRRQAAGRGAGYLDAAAGSLAAAPAENRLSRLAPYWLTPLKTEAPHWLGFGINPGLVELAARRLLEKRAAGRRRLVVFEFDRLAARLDGDRVAVGWSPAGLIEEMMRMPAFFVEADRACESADNCSGRVRVNWREKDLEVRRVAHEEIYNFSKSRRVAAAEFLYVLRPEVMRLLDGDPKGAERRLIVPPPEVPVSGREEVGVFSFPESGGRPAGLLWREEHGRLWKRLGVNAVQYQTCRGIQLAVQLLQETRLGRRPGTWTAFSLPLSAADWRDIAQREARLGIKWLPASGLRIGRPPGG